MIGSSVSLTAIVISLIISMTYYLVAYLLFGETIVAMKVIFPPHRISKDGPDNNRR